MASCGLRQRAMSALVRARLPKWQFGRQRRPRCLPPQPRAQHPRQQSARAGGSACDKALAVLVLLVLLIVGCRVLCTGYTDACTLLSIYSQFLGCMPSCHYSIMPSSFSLQTGNWKLKLEILHCSFSLSFHTGTHTWHIHVSESTHDSHA